MLSHTETERGVRALSTSSLCNSIFNDAGKKLEVCGKNIVKIFRQTNSSRHTNSNIRTQSMKVQFINQIDIRNCIAIGLDFRLIC